MGRTRNSLRPLLGPYRRYYSFSSLDDPITQVATVRAFDDLPNNSPKAGRFISPVSVSPSPPVGKPTQRFFRSRSVDIAPSSPPPTPSTTQDAHPKNDISGEATVDEKAGEPTAVQGMSDDGTAKESEVQEPEPDTSDYSTFEPDVFSTVTKGDLMTFLDELEKKHQRDDQLPKCSRFTSRQASRFELPCDMKILEDYTPISYLQKCCRVTSTKAESYKKIYKRTCKMNLDTCMKPEYLSTAFSDIFSRVITEKEIKTLKDLAKWDEYYTFDEKTFISIAALMERILTAENRNTALEEIDKKDDIELIDFSALSSKMEGISISSDLNELLMFIANS